MPTVLFSKGFRFYFYSDEGDEPCHVHVKKGNGQGKIWLEPVVEADYYYGFTLHEIKFVEKLIKENHSLLKNKWNEYFSK